MQLEEALLKLENLGLSDTEGMVQFTDEPKFPAYVSVPSKAVSTLFDSSPIFGQGLSKDNEQARIKSVAECIERICLFHAKGRTFLKEKYKTGSKFINPLDFLCFSEEQLRGNYLRHRTRLLDSEYFWQEAENHVTGEGIYVPAQLVFLSNDFTEEPIIREQISTGAALHSDATQALLSGTLECIERDAYITAYLTRKKLKKINVPGNSNLGEIIKYFKRYRLEPYIFDITNDLGIPSAMVITIDESRVGPAINLGLRSDFSYSEAVLGALIESIQCRRVTRLMKEVEYKNREVREDEIKSMNDRYFYWYTIDRISDLDFWLSKQETVDLERLENGKIDAKDKWNYLRDVFTSREYRLLSCDIAWPEVKAAGFSVVKVITPELHPLYLDERLKCMYSKHIGTIPQDLSLKPQPFT